MWRVLGLVVVGVGVSACHQNGTVLDGRHDGRHGVDVVPGDGVCADAGGACSLRAAVMEANALPGVEEIRLVDGAEYTLTIPEGTTEHGRDGRPRHHVRRGYHRGGTIVDGAAFGDIERIFHIANVRGLVEFDGVDFGAAFEGIRVEHSGSVIITRADFADAVEASLVLDGGFVNVRMASFTDGTTSFGDGMIQAISGAISLENVTITGTPGIYVEDASMTLLSSTILDSNIRLAPGTTGSVVIQSSIVGAFCSGPITSLGHNLHRQQCRLGGVSDQLVSYPTVGPVGDHGGGVLTVELRPFGQAVDAGLSSGCTLGNTDARASRVRGAQHVISGRTNSSTISLCFPAPRGRPAILRFLRRIAERESISPGPCSRMPFSTTPT
ncbi:MAG: hypothetical protein R2695_00150 [Acidimicrobiales bacterium]